MLTEFGQVAQDCAIPAQGGWDVLLKRTGLQRTCPQKKKKRWRGKLLSFRTSALSVLEARRSEQSSVLCRIPWVFTEVVTEPK